MYSGRRATKIHGESPHAAEGGFSLIELVVVVMIIAVLAVIAVPVFQGLEYLTKSAAVQTAAAIGAREAAAQLATGVAVNISHLEKGNIALVTYADNSSSRNLPARSVDGVCVTAVSADAAPITREAGPGC